MVRIIQQPIVSRIPLVLGLGTRLKDACVYVVVGLLWNASQPCAVWGSVCAPDYLHLGQAMYSLPGPQEYVN